MTMPVQAPGTPVPRVSIASRSEVGARSRNEDYLQHGDLGAGWYAVLSDGAGGHSDGAVAADLVVRMVVYELAAAQAGAEARADWPATLARVAQRANDALNERQVGLRGRQRMHATLVTLWIDRMQGRAAWVHVGDSRLYMLRRGRVASVTRDDSLLQSLVDAGYLDPAQLRSHPQRNQLLAAMGSEDAVDPHVGGEGIVVQDGDAFLLATDGWYGPIERGDIEDTLLGAASARDWLDRMARLVQSRAPPDQDNFSAVAVWIGDAAEVTRFGPPPEGSPSL